jgi:hypothetical protein
MSGIVIRFRMVAHSFGAEKNPAKLETMLSWHVLAHQQLQAYPREHDIKDEINRLCP